MSRQSGFTLIEVMVAIMLMAIVSLIAWRGLDSVSHADAHQQQSIEQHAALSRALNQLQRDFELRAGIELAEPLRPGDETAAIRHGRPAISLRSSDSDPLRLELVRVSAAQDGRIQRINWWVKGDTLYRASGAPRSSYPLAAPGNAIAVLDDLRQVEVRVWRPDRGWSQLAGSRAENPMAIELRFERSTAHGTERYRQVLGPLEE